MYKEFGVFQEKIMIKRKRLNFREPLRHTWFEGDEVYKIIDLGAWIYLVRASLKDVE